MEYGWGPKKDILIFRQTFLYFLLFDRENSNLEYFFILNNIFIGFRQHSYTLIKYLDFFFSID